MQAVGAIALITVSTHALGDARFVSVSPEHCESLRRAYEGLLEPNKGLLKDAKEKQDVTVFHWGRLRQAFEAVPPEVVQDLFDTRRPGALSVSDIDKVWFAIKSGELKATRQQEDFVDMLKMASSDHHDAFAPRDNMSFHILEALKKSEQNPLYGKEILSAAEFTDKAIAESEVNFLARALGEHRGRRYPNRKFGDGFMRQVTPHYKPWLQLLEFNNNMRSTLHVVSIADAPMSHALKKHQGRLDAQALSRIQALAGDTGGKVQQIRDQLKAVYGRELSMSDPLPEAEARMRDVSNGLETAKITQDLETATRQAEKDLDILDAELDRSLGGRPPMPEFEENHLRIRHTQYARETPELRDGYYSTTHGTRPEDSGYGVKYSWTETYRYSKRVKVGERKNSSTGRMEDVYETRHDTDTATFSLSETVHVDVEEVLRGQSGSHLAKTRSLPAAKRPSKFGWTLDSASQSGKRLDWHDAPKVALVIKRGERARAKEHPYRERVNEMIAKVDTVTEAAYAAIRGNEKATEATLAMLDGTRKQLQEYRDQIVPYSLLPDGQLRQQWSHDTGDNFRARNKRMLGRYDHLIKRIDHVREQVRRQTAHLELKFETRDYTEETAELKRHHDRIRAIQGVAAGAAAVSGVAYAVTKDETDKVVRENWDKLRKWLAK